MDWGCVLLDLFLAVKSNTFNPLQGAKKVSFMACHSGKLLLVCTDPRFF